MARRVLVVNGHPDPNPARLCAALAVAYAAGAASAGHEVRQIEVGAATFPLIRSYEGFVHDAPPEAVLAAQASITWADHLVIVYPLWLGGPPAVLKGFLEQTFRYGFALTSGGAGPRALLTGKSARLVVTMGMPAIVFRLAFGSFGLRAVSRGVLWISGFRPIRASVFGGVEARSQAARQAWLERMRRLGAKAV